MENSNNNWSVACYSPFNLTELHQETPEPIRQSRRNLKKKCTKLEIQPNTNRNASNDRVVATNVLKQVSPAELEQIRRKDVLEDAKLFLLLQGSSNAFDSCSIVQSSARNSSSTEWESLHDTLTQMKVELRDSLTRRLFANPPENHSPMVVTPSELLGLYHEIVRTVTEISQKPTTNTQLTQND